MAKSTGIAVRLLGPFGVDVHAGRAIAVNIRLRKSRALLAYLTMKPNYQAGREELATLFWGDHPDMQARHSLRQCLTSLRRDLRLAPDLLIVERDAVGLRPQDLVVDAREFNALAGSADAEACELYRGEFLADLKLDSEEFDAWRQREAARLVTKAAQLFEALALACDKSGHGERAIEAAERLVALEPTREDWQRTLLLVIARHRGRDAALARANDLARLLRQELDVACDKDTRALIESIKNGNIAPADAGHGDTPSPSADRDRMTLAATVKKEAKSYEDVKSCEEVGSDQAAAAIVLPAPLPLPVTAPEIPAHPINLSHGSWRRGGLFAAGLAALSLLGIAYVAKPQAPPKATSSEPPTVTANAATPTNASVEAKETRPSSGTRAETGTQVVSRDAITPVAVLPFAVDAATGIEDQRFAQALTHDLIRYLTRYQQLRVVTDLASDLYHDSAIDVTRVGATLGVRYAIIGRARISGNSVRVTFQLIDTTSRLNLWSSDVDRQFTNAVMTSDEMSRGIARALVIQIVSADARRKTRNASEAVDIGDLVTRARAAEQLGPWTENLSEAARLFEEGLRRDPHYAPAQLGIARVAVMAQGNWVEIDPPISLDRADQLIKEVLRNSPNSGSAHYILAQLQKLRGRYAESTQSFQRALELNPSFIFANAHIGNIMTRLGRAEDGLRLIQEYMRLAPDNEPAMGYAYLYDGESELALGRQQNALDAILRANSYFPDSPRVLGWLAAVYEVRGDTANAARFAAAFQKSSPARAARILGSDSQSHGVIEGAPPPVVLEALRAALIAARS